MYYLLSTLCGVIVAVMIVFNGELTAQYGVYAATVLIHIVGILPATASVLWKRDKPFCKRLPLPLLLGGVLGVGTTVCNNFAFGRISVSSILAVGLFAQSVFGLVVDQYGLFGMPKRPFERRKLVGLLLVLCGVGCMLYGSFSVLPALAAFLSGVLLVISRSLNAELAARTSVRVSTLFNYITGFVTALAVFLLLGRGEAIGGGFVVSPRWWIYLGGALGMLTVTICNVVTRRISAFYVSLFLFVGQVASGMALDAVIDKTFSPQNLVGGVLVAAGLIANLLLDQKSAA